MALNPEKLKLLYQKISNADSKSFSSICAQLFNYLNEEVKDNPVYDKLEKEREKWKDWPEPGEVMYFFDWKLPTNLEDVKSLAYDIYKSVAEQNDNGDKLTQALYRETSYDDNIYKFNKTFIEYLAEVLNDIISANPEIEIKENKKAKGDYVFIIHGHDKELKQEVQLLLQTAGVNNIILHEQPDKGRTIIDKLLEETEIAGYAIALLSPDDITEDGSKRARQNVILEIGYFIGRLGKERIRMVLKENVEIPSDLQGILYEKHDDGGAWKIKLLKEIQAVGIYVDLQSVVSKF
jgi:predicted nucleotide-binding protein